MANKFGRRFFLETTIRGGGLAVVAFPASFMAYEAAETSEHGQGTKDLDFAEARSLTVANFMRDYEINLEAAERLYDARRLDFMCYAALGAAGGSTAQSTASEALSMRRNVICQLFKSLGVPAFFVGDILTDYSSPVADTIKRTSLTSPGVLEQEYGFTPENAAIFIENHKRDIQNYINWSGLITSALQSKFSQPAPGSNGS